MNYTDDQRIVMTLDAGGTNFVFSAIRGGEEIVQPVSLPACADNLDRCLDNLTTGFATVQSMLPVRPVAISFAFPGPADYKSGVIGDLPNFPAFRGGIPLGPYLEEKFHMPVFINNDGNLFAYGEAMTGLLPQINEQLRLAGSKKRYHNILGVTLGTGFGAGVVIGGQLLLGDNGCGGDIWCLRNKKYPDRIIEESVSIRAVRRVYCELSGDTSSLTPKDIFEIAEGNRPGDRSAAIHTFEELGEMAGDTIATAITLIDGLVVIGGGLSGAAKYIVPAMMKELGATTSTMDDTVFPRLQTKAFNLDSPDDFARFAADNITTATIPVSGNTVGYDPFKRIGIAVTRQGTSRAISMGAYIFALNTLPTHS